MQLGRVACVLLVSARMQKQFLMILLTIMGLNPLVDFGGPLLSQAEEVGPYIPFGRESARFQTFLNDHFFPRLGQDRENWRRFIEDLFVVDDPDVLIPENQRSQWSKPLIDLAIGPELGPWNSYNGRSEAGGLNERWQRRDGLPNFKDDLLIKRDAQGAVTSQGFGWKNPEVWPNLRREFERLPIRERNRLSPAEKLAFVLDQELLVPMIDAYYGKTSPDNGEPAKYYHGTCDGARHASQRFPEPACPIAVINDSGAITYFQPTDIKMLLAHVFAQNFMVPPFSFHEIERDDKVFWINAGLFDAMIRLSQVAENFRMIVDTVDTSTKMSFSKTPIRIRRLAQKVRRLEDPQEIAFLAENMDLSSEQLGNGNYFAQDIQLEGIYLSGVSTPEANSFVGNRKFELWGNTFKTLTEGQHLCPNHRSESSTFPKAAECWDYRYTLFYRRDPVQRSKLKLIEGCFRPGRAGSRCYQSLEKGSRPKRYFISYGYSGQDNRAKLDDQGGTRPVDQGYLEKFAVNSQAVLKLAEYSSVLYDPKMHLCRQFHPLRLKESSEKYSIAMVPWKIQGNGQVLEEDAVTLNYAAEACADYDFPTASRALETPELSRGATWVDQTTPRDPNAIIPGMSCTALSRSSQ